MRPWLPGNSPMAPWGAMAPSLGTTALVVVWGHTESRPKALASLWWECAVFTQRFC